MAHLFLSAAHKSSGKTTVALGLCAAFAAQGLRVAPFKKGPDYIDPLWLATAADHPCINLDFNTQGLDELRDCFARALDGADIGLIEGNKGLYDGLDLDGSNSNAALATLLDAPVILVLDARGMTRGIAPLILGYQAFEPAVRIAGVILNRLGGSRHESKLRAVIEHYTEVKVLGAVQQDTRLSIVERHLGLMPSNEAKDAAARIKTIAEIVRTQVDLPALRAIAQTAPWIESSGRGWAAAPEPNRVRLGIARDAAFGFYYADDLDALRAAGAELVVFDALHDARLPAVDGLFIGGGFPETHSEALQANAELRAQIRTAIEAGMPAYAECGGLMYLARSITWGVRRNEMVGVIPGDVVMHDRPQGRGYIHLRETGLGPWGKLTAQGEFRAHEFHYASLENLAPGLPCAYEVRRVQGIDGHRDGLIYKNLLAGFAHLRHTRHTPWATRFVALVRACAAAD